MQLVTEAARAQRRGSNKVVVPMYLTLEEGIGFKRSRLIQLAEQICKWQADRTVRLSLLE